MSDRNNSLENYVVEKLKVIDKYTRKREGSGCVDGFGDIVNKYVFCGAKQKHTHTNFIIDRQKDWISLASKMPNFTDKFLFLINENKFGEKMVSLTADDFFKLLYKVFESEE